MGPKGSKWFQMGPNDSKHVQIGKTKNGPKWSKCLTQVNTCQNRSKQVQTGSNRPKWSKMVQIGPKWSEIIQRWPKLPNMAMNGKNGKKIPSHGLKWYQK